MSEYIHLHSVLQIWFVNFSFLECYRGRGKSIPVDKLTSYFIDVKIDTELIDVGIEACSCTIEFILMYS